MQELGDVPLALEHAGAYIYETRCGLSGYLERYQTQPVKLLKKRGTSVESVAATWNLAVKEVGQANRAAVDLLRLCAFLAPDAIPEEIIREGAPDLSPALRGLLLIHSNLMKPSKSFSNIPL